MAANAILPRDWPANCSCCNFEQCSELGDYSTEVPVQQNYLGSEASTQAKKLESSCNFMLKSTILLLYSFSKRQLSSCNYSTVSDCKSVVVEKFQVKLESLLRTSSWLDYFLWLMITWPDSNCRDWGTLISDFADQNMLSEFEGHWVTQNSCCQWASKHSIHRQYPAFTISSIGPGLSSNIWIL